MQCIALNSNNDIYVDVSGNLAMAKDLEAVITSVSCETKTNYGEVVLDTTKGVPYFTTIFVAHPDIDLWKSYMEQAILQVPKVLSIEYFKTFIDYDNSLLKYVAVINTEYGEGEING